MIHISKMKPLWLSLAFLISHFGLTEAYGLCRQDGYSIYGMFLKRHTFKAVQATFPAECHMICEQELRCQSFNVIIGKNICELNSRTKEARPEDFMADLHRFYMKRTLNRGNLYVSCKCDT